MNNNFPFVQVLTLCTNFLLLGLKVGTHVIVVVVVVAAAAAAASCIMLSFYLTLSTGYFRCCKGQIYNR